ncbi:MAG TPA: ACP synthase [Polyangia bacterium]
MSLQLRSETSEGGHLGELRLRRLRAGELNATEAASAEQHLEGCASCRARLDALAAEERGFFQTIAYPRFAGGVERAARVPRPERRVRRNATYGVALGLASAAALLLLFRPGTGPLVDPTSESGGESAVESGNRSKGGTSFEATIRIASADGRAQRSAAPGSTTHLGPGERLRVGYAAPGVSYVMVFTVDDAGAVSSVFDEAGDSARVVASKGTVYLPDSLELTGAGHERLFFVAGKTPFPGGPVHAAVREALNKAGGDLVSMAPPRLPAEVTGFSWLFRKP